MIPRRWLYPIWAGMLVVFIGYLVAARIACAQDIPNLDKMPVEQRLFLHAVFTAQLAVMDAKNDMQKGGARAAREKAICERLPNLQASNWIGTVYRVTSNSAGKGVLELLIAPDVYVKTWNNAFSDAFDHTLIEPGTAVFNGASQLEKGQLIAFSGQFVADTTGSGCVRESSLTLDGKLREPEFIFRFQGVAPHGQ